MLEQLAPTVAALVLCVPLGVALGFLLSLYDAWVATRERPKEQDVDFEKRDP